jgi:hypothetical protein
MGGTAIAVMDGDIVGLGERARMKWAASGVVMSQKRDEPAQLEDLIQTIRARAYEIWEISGRPVGQHREHWLQAERELRPRSADAENRDTNSADVDTKPLPKKKPSAKRKAP